MSRLELIRICIASICLIGTAWADVSVVTGGGVTYQIDEKSSGGLTSPANFQQWPLLCVKSCSDCNDPCTDTDFYDANNVAPLASLNGQQLLLGQDFLGNVLVQRKIYVSGNSAENFNAFVRYLDVFTNPTDADLTITVHLGTFSGQNAQGRLLPNDARVQRSHHFADDQIDPDDRWVLMDDGSPDGGFAAVATLVWGGGGLRPYEHLQIQDAEGTQVRWAFRLTLPPNGTRSLMTIIATEDKRLDALAEIEALLRVDVVALLNGLSDQERREIANFDVDPVNAAPIADAGGRYVISEGSTVTLQGADSIDVEGAPLSFGWHLSPTEDLAAPYDGTETNLSTVFPDNGFYPIRLTVVDDLGKTDRVYAGVQVNNVAPTIDAFTTSSPIGEGDSLVVKVVASDPGQDQLTYYYDWEGNGTFGMPMPSETETIFRNDGVFPIRAMVRDDDGGITTAQAEIVVQNLPPNILQVVVPPEVGEEQVFPLTVIAQDPGNDPMRFSIDADGDGIFEMSQDGDPTFSISYPDNGFFTLTIRACDNADACQEKTATVSVGNLPPIIDSVSVTSPVDEGGMVDFVVLARDSLPDQNELSYGFDFDNDGDFLDDLVQTSPEASYRFERAGTYRIGIRVSDSDGGVSRTSVEVVVNNLNPTVELQGPQFAQEGERVTFACSATDQGSQFLAIDWDLDADGAFERPNTTQSVETTFPDEGTYIIKCRVRDGSGGVAEGTLEVLVSNVAPAVTFEVSGALIEGGEVIVRVIATDPSTDTLSYRFDFDGDSVADAPASEENIGRHTYSNEGDYQVTIWVSDGTDESRVTTNVVVLNRAPNLILVMTNEADEGDELTLRAEVTDPGNDPVRLEWDLDGDGVAELVDESPVQNGVAEQTFSLNDNGRYNLTVWAYDDEGASQLASTSITVNNVAPTLVAGYAPLPAREGEQYASVIPIFDPAGVADPLTYQLLAGPANIELDPVTGLLLWTPSYEEYLASPTLLTVRVSDGDAGVLELNLTVIVLPKDDDMDGLPDSYESRTCDENGDCLDPTDGTDAQTDLDNDGLSNLEEWAAQSNPFQYDGPSKPILLSPVDGDRVNTATPVLEVEVEPFLSDRRAWVRFELYADEALSELIASEETDLGQESIIGWSTDDVLLSEDMRYFWRARASTDLSQTDWSETFRFVVNAVNVPPPPPILLSPSDNAVLSERSPTFTAQTVVDTDGDQVRYLFRFYRPNGDIETLGYGQVDEGLTTLTQTHREGAVLLWEVIAVDEVGAQSVGGEQWDFTIDALNKAPGMPTILLPEDRALYDQNPLRVSMGENEDEDGHDFKYVLSVYGEDVNPLVVGQVDAEADGSAIFESDVRLGEDRGYNLVVYAEDELGARSESAIHQFFLSSENNPPSRPELLGPTNLAPLTTNQTILNWEQSSDPEGADVTYRVTVCTQDPADLESLESCFVKDLILLNGFDFRGESRPGTNYFWFVEAVDELGLASEPSAVWQFRVVVTETDSSGCDCQVDSQSPTSTWFLLLGFLAFTLRRRQGIHY